MLFVTNIRYGNSPVRKVYLGEKLIWQCVDVAGNAESSLDAAAHFYATNIDSLFGESKNMSHNDAMLNKPGIVLFISDTGHHSYTDSVLDAVKISPMSSDSTKSETYMDVFMKIFNANPMNGLSDSKSDTLVESRLVVSDDMVSKINIDCGTNDTIGLVLMSEFVGGDGTSNFDTTSSMIGCNKSDLMSHVMIQSDVNGAILLLTSLGMRSSVESILNNNSIADVIDAVIIKSTMESSSDADGLMRFYQALPGYSSSKVKTSTNSFIGKYFAIVIDANANSESYGSASTVLWYPPIGDGIPLFEKDDIDITANGNTLEIQQAYQINIDEENGILEVI